MKSQFLKLKRLTSEIHPLFRKITIGYGLWIIIAVLFTIFQENDTSIGAHLALMLTGFPVALLSLFCALDGSILAVVLAGGMGLAQWLGLAYLLTKREADSARTDS